MARGKTLTKSEDLEATKHALQDGNLLDESSLDQASPLDEALPELASVVKARGRPKQATTKVSATIRWDPEVINHFKAKGKGWQTMMNNQLKKDIEEGRV